MAAIITTKSKQLRLAIMLQILRERTKENEARELWRHPSPFSHQLTTRMSGVQCSPSN